MACTQYVSARIDSIFSNHVVPGLKIDSPDNTIYKHSMEGQDSKVDKDSLSVKMSVATSTQPSSASGSRPGEIVLLNVGGKR